MTERDPRQANHLIRAVRYQLLQSVDAWLNLQPGQELLLEVDEDFSVASAERSEDVQVKHSATVTGPKSVSLRSAGLRTAILSYWGRSQGGQNTKPNLTFLATADAVCEAGIHFPGEVPGLRYWPTVANFGDTSPLRQALLEVFHDTPIGHWLSTNPSDDELRVRLLQRVRFALNATTDTQLEALIQERVGVIYLAKGHLVDCARQCVPKLLYCVFSAAGNSDAAARRLSVVDLHDVIEEAIPRAGALVTAPAAGYSYAVTTISARSGLIARRAVIDEIQRTTAGSPIIWIEGAHGTGKSILATLLAQARGGSWLLCDFRPHREDGDIRSVLPVWNDFMMSLSRGDAPAGVILDDLSERGLGFLKTRIAALAETFGSRGAKIIVTSNHTPPPALLAEMGAPLTALVSAPYFSIEEVRELVRQYPAPDENAAEGWAQLVHLTTSGGHPVLTISKIAGLRARQWPAEALLEDLGPKPSRAIEVTRQEARRRLLEDLPFEPARELLDRASSVFGAFEDNLVVLLCGVSPAVPRPKDILAILRGSWIEPAPSGGMRLSPLIADLATDVPLDKARLWRKAAAEYWLQQGEGTLDARTLPLCFWNAFLGEHQFVLARVALLILELPREKLRAAASLLSPLAALRTDVFPKQPMIVPSLRLLQICVADAVEDQKTANNAALVLLREIDEMPVPAARLVTITTAAWHVFQTDRIRLPPETLVTYLSRLKTTGALDDAQQKKLFQKSLRELPRSVRQNIDLRGMLFAQLLSRISSSTDLEQIMGAVAGLEASERVDLFRMANLIFGGDWFFVHAGWAKEQLANQDLGQSLTCYQRSKRIADDWGIEALSAEFVVALSTIYDEGMGDTAQALAVLDAESDRRATNPVLVRQKCKVLAHAGNFSQAATLFLTVEGAEEKRLSAFERSLILREGAVTCAKAGRLEDAARLFEGARSAIADAGSHVALRIGLGLEEALVAWSRGDRCHALSELSDALEKLNSIDPRASRQNLRAHRFARALIGLFHHDVSSMLGDVRPTIAFGSPSMLEGSEEPDEAKLWPLKDNWRLLEIVEIAAGVDVGIAERSARNQTAERILSIEVMLSKARYVAALKRKDTAQALATAQLTTSIFCMMRERKAPNLEFVRSDAIRARPISELAVSELGEAIQGAVVDLMLVEALEGKLDDAFARKLEKHVCEVWAAEGLVKPLLAASSGLYAIGPEASRCVVASWYLRLLDEDKTLLPPLRFARDLNLLCHISASFARDYLEKELVARVVDGWRNVIGNQKFYLTDPIRTVPLIEAELENMMRIGLKGAGALFDVLAGAVTTKVPPAARAILNMMSKAELTKAEQPISG